jgi:hypothetical protein
VGEGGGSITTSRSFVTDVFFDFVSDENEVSEKVFLGTSDPMTELSIRALCHNFGKFIRTSSAP